MPATPEAYLAATRRLRGDFIPQEYYQDLYDCLRSGISGLGTLPDLFVTYSTSRVCETLDVGGSTFIIYDVYLGQTLNQFNRLHFNSSNRWEMVGYACKVLAEEMQLAGRSGEALALALSYRTIQKRFRKTLRKDRDLHKRLMTTLIQEAYVLAHESMHFILAKNPAWRSQAIADARGDFLANHLHPALESIREAEGASQAESLLRQIEIFETDDALVEECVCDTLAVPMIWGMFAHQSDIPTIRSAIFFALRHLRVLTILKTYARWIALYSESPERTLEPYLVRTGFLQFVLKQFKAFCVEVSSDINDSAFMAEQERYETFVGDPVVEEVYTRVLRFMEAMRSAPHLKEADDLDARVDDLVGNSPLAVQAMHSLGERHFQIAPGSLTADQLALWKQNTTKQFKRAIAEAQRKRVKR